MSRSFQTPQSSDSYPIWQQPKKLALIIGVVIALWVLSGLVFSSDDEAETEQTSISQNSDKKVSEVPIKIETLTAQTYARTINLNGVTEPDRLTLIEAETEGKVEKIYFNEGDQVKDNAVLIQLDLRDRRNSVAEAEALVKQRKIEYSAAKKLHQKGFQSKVRLAQTESALASARRQLEQAKLDLNNTTIRAPYAGLIEEILVEEGDLAGRGFNKQTVMRFVDLSPLKIRGQVSEQERSRVKKGDTASVRLSSGKQVEGKVEFIASVADEDTRTFRMEIAVPNPEGAINAGLSAEISLTGDQVMAYQFSSALLALNDAGEVGIKRVDDEGMVSFEVVNVLAQSDKGVWVDGLPEQIRVVTDGAAFVSDGQKVESSQEQSSEIDKPESE